MSAATLVMVISALVISAIELLVGFTAGWMVRGEKKEPEATSEPTQPNEQELRRVQSALLDMQGVAAGVAADVGEHSARVERISQDLNESADGASVAKAVRDIVTANEALQNRLEEAEKRLAEQAEQLKTQETAALTDPLTGIRNRRAFDADLERRFAEWFRLGTPVSLMMIDVDFFKKFNDQYGHQAGDEVLKGMARTFQNTVREIDVAARYGGEEFAVIMPGTQLEQAKIACERVRQAAEAARFTSENKELKATISIGLSEVNNTDTLESLIKRADDALYAAKKGGRNRAYLHDGQETRPVLAAATKAPTAEELEAERRKFCRKQRVAAYDGGVLPAIESFREVQCQDISVEGFSFLAREGLNLDNLVVALGTAPHYTFMAAAVVRTVPVAVEYGGGFKVECRFTHRFALDENGQRVAVPLGSGELVNV